MAELEEALRRCRTEARQMGYEKILNITGRALGDDALADMRRDDERLFTASEVQAAITAVILYERALAECRMRVAAAPLMGAIDAHRREIRPNRHMMIDEIRKGLGG